MAEIKVLDQDTINQIAAGEVVERPASIVKELVENAVDASSTAVTVVIKGGAIDFIRITDNGCGIEKEQVRKAFLPHATSKIRSADDLETVASLGFRGEALSSIAAVQRWNLSQKRMKGFPESVMSLKAVKKRAAMRLGVQKEQHLLFVIFSLIHRQEESF